MAAAADQDRDQRDRRFRALYQANFRPVQGYAVNRLGHADDVPDVVAEVFTVAWRRLADIPPPPADRFWLYGTARRVIARRHRSAGRPPSSSTSRSSRSRRERPWRPGAAALPVPPSSAWPRPRWPPPWRWPWCPAPRLATAAARAG
jgi:DNA-directed RNA polymerase specialized sigma24 family protein